MSFKNTEEYLNKYAKSISDEYKKELNLRGYDDTVSYSVELLGNEYIVIFKLNDYWKFIEDGRKPGKMPPINSILKWIKQKGLKPRNRKIKSNKQLAFLIARKIGRFGIKPKKLFEKSIDRVNKNFKKGLIDAFKKDINNI